MTTLMSRPPLVFLLTQFGRKEAQDVGHAFCLKKKHVVAYMIRSKDCRTCAAAMKKGQTPTKHNCRINWSNGRKVMEANLRAKLMKDISQSPEGIAVKLLVAGDNCTTLKRILEVYNTVEKWS